MIKKEPLKNAPKRSQESDYSSFLTLKIGRTKKQINEDSLTKYQKI